MVTMVWTHVNLKGCILLISSVHTKHISDSQTCTKVNLAGCNKNVKRYTCIALYNRKKVSWPEKYF